MRYLIALSIALTLVACGGGSSSNTSATATRSAELTELATAQAPTPTTIATATTPPTATPTNTATPEPTDTPRPTRTPRPTPPPAPTATPANTATPTPPPTPTMTVDEQKAQYRGDLDIREVDKNWQAYEGWKLYYEGEVLSLQVFSTGVFMQVMIQYPGGSQFDRVPVVVTFLDPNISEGIFEDDNVAFWGRPIDTFTGTNGFGATITQVQFAGDFLEKR